MDLLPDGTRNPAGDALVAELAWVHGVIRAQLAEIEALTARVVAGVPAAAVQQQLQGLAASNLVWTLRTGCLRYCQLVHHHHAGEDRSAFPALRRINPSLRPVLAKLEADHITIAVHLDTIEAIAQRLAQDETARADLAAALNGLSGHLLTHLRYEEDALNPTLRRLPAWPQA